MPRTNRYAGRCQVCDIAVQANQGYIDKIDGKWVTYCTSDRCLPQAMQDEINKPVVKKLTADGKIIMPFDREALPLIKGMPGARFNRDGDKAWTVSTEPQDRRRVIEVATKLGLEIAPALLIERLHPLAEQAQARCKAGVVHPKFEGRAYPYAYQTEGIVWLAALQNAILADDMGLGKTIQVLLGLDATKGTIVVVPKSVKLNWAEECRIWRPDITPFVLEGRDAWRWPNPGELVITNEAILPKWLLPTKKVTRVNDYNGRSFNVTVPDVEQSVFDVAARCHVVADEIHLFKNYKSQRTRKMAALVDMCASAWGMTGTPLENKPPELWTLFQVFGLAFKVFGSFNNFKRLFNASHDRWGMTWGMPLPEVPERLRRYMLRRIKADVAKFLPPKVFTDLKVEIKSKSLKKTMDKHWDKWGDTIEDGELPSFEEFSKIRSALAKDRIPAMLEVVESYEDAGKPLIVASAHRAPIAELAKRDGWVTITGDTSNEKRQEIVRDFQDGKYKGIGLTIRAAGVGLTLTFAQDMLFVDRDWVPTWNTQCQDRIHRIGAEGESCNYIFMVTDHPLDIHVASLLAQKEALISASIENTVNYEPKKAKPAGPEITPISDEEFQSRLDAIKAAQEEANRSELEKKLRDVEEQVPRWLGRMRERATEPEVELTNRAKPVIREAFFYMLSVCDGARERDGVGFNKPDAAIANLLLMVGLDTDEKLRIAERILSRYKRQLHSNYPGLFVREFKKKRPHKNGTTGAE